MARVAEARRAAEVRDQLSQRESVLQQTVKQRDRLDQQGRLLQAEIQQLSERLDRAGKTENSLLLALNAAREEDRTGAQARARLELEKRALRRDVAGLQQEKIASQARQADLVEGQARRQKSLSESRAEVDALRSQRDLLQLRLTGVHERLRKQRNAQRTVLATLRARTQDSTVALQGSIAKTGLKPEQYLAQEQSAQGAQGGPFMPLLPLEEDSELDADWRSSVARLEADVSRWEQLMKLVRSLPLVNPVAGENWISSGYGYRRDPLNGRKALHGGLDIAGKLKTKVKVASAGKVIFAGWKTGYGRVISIDHGYGLVTRYAHLNKILVKQGQQVAANELIGLLGSSGRSTGPHVHYEIRFKDKARNPRKFLKAGQNVQEIKKEGRI